MGKILFLIGVFGLIQSLDAGATGIVFNIMTCNPVSGMSGEQYQIKQMMYSAPGGPVSRTASFSVVKENGNRLHFTMPFISYVRDEVKDTVIYTNKITQPGTAGFVHFYHQGKKNLLQFEILMEESSFGTEGLLVLDNYHCETKEHF